MPPKRALRAPSLQPEWPRGPNNELQHAAYDGLTERTIALLASGQFDINQGNPEGFTPLICASRKGHSGIVRILLNKGANLWIANCDGFTALHISSQHGHLEVAEILVEAGADLEAKTLVGSTPLHQAAENGRASVITMLTEAGADVNSPRWASKMGGETFGETPLHLAVTRGHVSATRALLVAKANAVVTMASPVTGAGDTPLEYASFLGHFGVVRELLRHRGIRGCGGTSGGVEALGLAAGKHHMEIMELLTVAGVVDTGIALARAATQGREAPVAFLLENHASQSTGGTVSYVNARNMDEQIKKPLFCSIMGCSPRVVRRLIDAGADTTASFTLLAVQEGGREVCRVTPLTIAEQYISGKTGERKLTEQDLKGLEVIRRLLMQVDAIHAVSWLWHAPLREFGRATRCTGRSTTNPAAAGTPTTTMLPLVRRRAARRGMALQALFRFSKKP